MEQELPTLPEHLSFNPGCQWGSFCSIFSFLCSVLYWPLFVLLYFVLLVIVWLPLRARSTTSCDKSCQWPTGRWFSPGPPISSTNKTDRRDIAEILLKVALNTIKTKTKPVSYGSIYHEGVLNTMTENRPRGQYTMGVKIPYNTKYVYHIELSQYVSDCAVSVSLRRVISLSGNSSFWHPHPKIDGICIFNNKHMILIIKG